MSRRNRTRTTTRLCASCGQPFTWTSRNPRRRFCAPACKARWWRASNTDTTTPPNQHTTTDPTEVPRDVSGVCSAVTANAVTPSYDPYAAGYDTGQAPSAIQNCPNCHQPVAVINLLVTTTAAYVNTPRNTPSRSVTDASECRSI